MIDDNTQFDIERIFSGFEVPGSFVRGYPYGNGHINDTFCVETSFEGTRRYILQRVNHSVFKEPVRLMENILRVTEHVRKKLEEQGRDPDRHGLTLLPTKQGGHWHIDDAGNVWRLYIFIEESIAYDVVDSPAVAFEGGKAFGEFQRSLADLPGEPLFETIPEFHSMGKRLDTYKRVCEEDRMNRGGEIQRELDFVAERADGMQVLQRLGREGRIPIRITHNDTKINNVLFDESSGDAACVIDLDTVMPGYVHYDFGDSIRTATNTGAEDDEDLSAVSMSLDLFEGYAGGYLSQASAFLTETEVAYLADSAMVMTFIIGLRFLTDFLDGDRYFKIHRPDHNIVRARAQFKLVSSMEEQRAAMKDVIDRLYEDNLHG